MTRIAPVNLSFSQKVFWFDAGDLEISREDQVVVDTVHGLELGKMANDIFEPTEDQMKRFKNDLKPVVRIATPDDLYSYSENEQYAKEALAGFREVIEDQKKDMTAISVEFSLDRAKAVFCYEAENRVDFREMVKLLARKYHTRIEMRQITPRERARDVGGFGACGQQLCCSRLGCGFSHVTVRMAKEQGLALNQQKISGCCGRLMCCLRYEFEEYKVFNKRAPKMNAKVSTPEGVARVCGLDMIHDSVMLRVDPPADDSKQKGESHEVKRSKVVRVPLDSFDEPKGDSKRPNSVSAAAWEEAQKPPETEFEASGYFGDSTKKFTRQSALGDAQAHRANTANRKNATGSVSMSVGSRAADLRGGAGGAGGSAAGSGAAEGAGGKSKNKRNRKRRRRGVAEGGLVGGGSAARRAGGGNAAASGSARGGGGAGASGTGNSSNSAGRVRRRRSVTVGSDGKKTTSNNAGDKKQNSSRSIQNNGAQNSGRGNSSNAPRKSGVRPGQRSSSLRSKKDK